MKAVKKLVVLLSVSALPMVAVKAATPEQAYLESYRRVPGAPVPVSVVSPTVVGSEFHGTSVQLEFVVDVQGRPTGFKVVSSPDPILAELVVGAVKQWRFLPAEANGTPVATRVALPVKIVDPALAGTRYAASN